MKKLPTENALRKRLNRQGYYLTKSRKPTGANNLGGYMICEISGNHVARGSDYELDLKDVNDFYNEILAFEEDLKDMDADGEEIAAVMSGTLGSEKPKETTK